jgi:SAM-dependent methyltransferase
MAPSESSYIHGTTPEEQARLTSMNELLNRASLQELALREGDRVLDLGAGLCQLARGMARATRRPVVGVERSAEQIAEALRQARADGEAELLDLRQGDAAALPLSPAELGSFDVAHARFLLEHLRDPLSAVRQMVAAVRPGGRVVLVDDDHALLRLHPSPPGFQEVFEAFVRGYDRLGNDPFVGRRLPSLLHEAGAAPSRITWVFFGGCAGQPSFRGVADNLVQVLLGARGLVLEVGVEARAFDTALEAIGAFARRPDAAIWYAMAWAEGRVPG